MPSFPCALPNTWHIGSQSLPGKHITECRVVVLTSLVSPPTASFACNSFSLICLFFFSLTAAVFRAGAFERFLCNNSPPPTPRSWRPGRLVSGDLVGNGFWAVANGPLYRDTIMQVTLPWLQTQPRTSGKLVSTRMVHGATLHRIFSTCCKSVDKYIRNKMVFFSFFFFPLAKYCRPS